MTSGIGLRLCLAAVVAAGVAGAPRAGLAALRDWDQERVTELASELAKSIRELRSAERKVVRPDFDTQERARAEYMDTLKALEQSSRQLQNRLAEGAGREKTLPIARKLRTLVRNAETNGKKFMSTEQTMSRITPAYDALEALAPYYFEDPGAPDPMVQRALDEARKRQGEGEGAP